MDTIHVAVIIASVRDGRFGPTVADWFTTRAARRPRLRTDRIDLAETELPMALPDFDAGEARPPAVAALAVRLAAADAFVVVTPEYNQSVPASLKNAIDWFDAEWHAKPVAVIGYGRDTGGALAAAHLRQVFAELDAVTIRDCVLLPRYWELFAADGSWPRRGAECDDAVTITLDRLTWWADALRTARATPPADIRH